MTIKGDLDFPDPDKSAGRAVDDALEYILQQSNKIVPLEEGTLMRSGKTDRDGTQGTVSYDTPYAVKQHEDRSLSHDHGRQSKYLERTAKNEQQKVRDYLAEHLKDLF
jgi:hypothetical protein